MRVRNRHSRELDRPVAEVEALLSTLGTRDDALWPTHLWFPMRLDGRLRSVRRAGTVRCAAGVRSARRRR